MKDYTVKKYRKGRAGIADCIYSGKKSRKNEGRRMSASTKIRFEQDADQNSEQDIHY